MKNLYSDSLYSEIKQILQDARQSAYRSVNFAMVLAYWKIGSRIVIHEQLGKKRAGYGEGLLKELSKKLTVEFGKGFALASLKNYRQFYLSFSDTEKGSAPGSLLKETAHTDKSSAMGNQSSVAIDPTNPHALRSGLTWTHYRLLMRVENINARNFYMNEAITENWSTRALERQINSFYYERIVPSKNNKGVIEEGKEAIKLLSPTPEDFIKDPYVLEFLNLHSGSGYSEKDVENAIIQKLQQFMLEMGKGFSFVAQQKRISVEDDHFYVDLVFYNYVLKCFVLIDLKLSKLNHQDIGQMDLYVRWFEDNLRSETDNPTIGIILCSEKNETIVKYSILKESKQLFASKYKLYLPTEAEFRKEVERELLHFRLENK
jgi:predicted nuclease of restriction endonuclease-like (RecB) superfamily